MSRARLIPIKALMALMLSEEPADINVAVAAKFTEPAGDIAPLKQKSGQKAVFGASRQLYSQIAQGGPFQVILSADDSRPKKLVEDGLAVRKSRLTYASGNLVRWSRTAKFVNGSDTFRTESILKLPICNSAAALYGAAAVEAMKAIDVYEGMQPKLVEGATITQAYPIRRDGQCRAQRRPAFATRRQQDRFALARAAGVCDPILQGVVRLETDANNRATRAFRKGPGSLRYHCTSMTMCSNA
ncbi:molybdate ABC transporter substrate-binding protein [Bradyrhizobium sp. CSA112]|uniref:molybdate ABC transporter substrate-binding protein n=1 Tax=Bradyrhizobium sp. CSA112 TaxID=2699170 RepID=UPI0023AE8CA9|nr:molybdate ABC transporter substrate-binding protein [Bradyrhizobium sp. CSA112]MDE5458267.1 molybdate ABC transporter substrate-binding protein [Bradyrhizobium sp. CSA112]